MSKWKRQNTNRKNTTSKPNGNIKMHAIVGHPVQKLIPSSDYRWMFLGPSGVSDVLLDHQVWETIKKNLPPSYAVPDVEFLLDFKRRAASTFI